MRQYSYERQLAAGFKNPGYAGITFDRISDEPWTPETGGEGGVRQPKPVDEGEDMTE